MENFQVKARRVARLTSNNRKVSQRFLNVMLPYKFVVVCLFMYENEFYLHVNKFHFSHFEKEAKSN